MEHQKSFIRILSDLMIKDVPSYANKLFYSLGFLSMIAFAILLFSGGIMVFFGPNWWLTSGTGEYLRSVHLWATQAFVLFILLHLLIVFLTSGFKPPRRLTWVLGAMMFIFVLLEAEFGYVLRGDFSSQWRSLQGADLYNGSGIGAVLNSLNYKQIYGIHIMVVPLAIIGLLFLHYLLVRVRGIAKPYRSDVPYRTVPANHTVLFLRGGALILVILALAKIFPSPFILPTTVRQIAQEDPQLMATTLIQEMAHTSDTATYVDNLRPYTYDTRAVYVTAPYQKLVQAGRIPNRLGVFATEPLAAQDQQIASAGNYFAKSSAKLDSANPNPVISAVSSLVVMGQSGLYQTALSAANPSGDTSMYVLRFLADSGVMDKKAEALGMTTQQYGMLSDEPQGHYTPGAWWLAPLGLMDHTILANDGNQDRDGAIIIGLLALTFVAFPYIPYLNQLPDKLKIYKFIWRERPHKAPKS